MAKTYNLSLEYRGSTIDMYFDAACARCTAMNHFSTTTPCIDGHCVIREHVLSGQPTDYFIA